MGLVLRGMLWCYCFTDFVKSLYCYCQNGGKTDHVYFVHPSTDILVDISTDTWPMYWWTYRPSVDQYVGRHSADMSNKMCRLTYRPMYQPRYRPSDGRHIDRLSANISVDIAAETQPIRWPLIVGGILVGRRWYISQKLRLLVYKLYPFYPFFGQPQKFLKASCLPFMYRKFSRY